MNSISILGCGWLGLPLARHLVNASLMVRGSTTSESKIQLLKKDGILPYHLQLTPELSGNTKDFFDSDILLINLPPRNKDRIPGFHEDQLKSILAHATGRIKCIIFISSTAVYKAENQEVSESNATIDSLTRGGIPLLAMENLFIQNTSFETTVIRFGGLYGPGRHPGNFLAGRKNLAGAGNPINMIHLDDCIGIIQTIIEQNIWGEVFNACSPSKETRKTFYEKAASELGIEPPSFSDESAPFKKVSSDKFVRQTGYFFRH